jgi:hypothetical protein
MLAGLLLFLGGLLACGAPGEPVAVPPLTPGLGPVRPSPLAAGRTPDPCEALRPLASPPVGTVAQGPYVRLRLPPALATLDAAGVTAGLAALEQTPEWACMKRLYPEASAIYLALAGRTPLTPPRPTPTGRPAR